MARSILFAFIALFPLLIGAQVSRIDALYVGTHVSFFLGQCGEEIPEAKGRLSFCDAAGNLGVVTRSLGLNHRGTEDLLPNLYNDSEVYLTRQGISIRHAAGDWENIPNIALPRPDGQDIPRNDARATDGFVSPEGLLYLISNPGGQQVVVYDLDSKDLYRFPLPDFQSAARIVYDTDREQTWVLGRSQGNLTLYVIRDQEIVTAAPLTALDAIAYGSINKLEYRSDTLWLASNRGLHAIAVDELVTGDYPFKTYDQTQSGRLPADEVVDFEFAEDDRMWLLLRQNSGSIFLDYDRATGDYRRTQQFIQSSNPPIALNFSDFAILPDGRLTFTASNYFGLLDLDFSGDTARWTRIDRDSLSSLGVDMTYTPSAVRTFNGRTYYLTNDGSSGNNEFAEVGIRDGGVWTTRNDDLPGNYSFWELERFLHFRRDDAGGLWLYNADDNRLGYLDADDQLRSRSYRGLPYLPVATDAEGRLVFNQTSGAGWTLADWPFELPIAEVQRSNSLVAAAGNILAFFDRGQGTLTRLVNGAVVARDTLPEPSTYGSFFDFALDDAGNAWMASDNRGPGTTVLHYAFAGDSLTRYELSEEIGEVVDVLPAPEGRMYVVGQMGVILFEDGEIHTMLSDEEPALRVVRDAVVDAGNRLFLLTNFVGTIVRITDLEDSPQVSVSQVENLLPFTELYGSTTLEIDSDGDMWVEGQNSLYKLVDEISDPSYRARGEASTLSGRVYADANENGSFDEGEAIANQAVVINGAGTSFQTYTDQNGVYRSILDTGNAEFTVTLPTVDRFYYTDLRQQTVAVEAIDRDYDGVDFLLEVKNYESLFFTTANKQGAWGFERAGFDNVFTHTVTNLSTRNPFNELTVDYQFFNVEPGANIQLPDIEGVRITRLTPTGVPFVVSYLRIDPRSNGWRVVGLQNDNYTSTELTANYSVSSVPDSTRVRLELGSLGPRETLVVEIETGTFDGSGNGNFVGYGVIRVSSTPASANDPLNRNVVVLYPDADDGVAQPYDDPNSPYIDPDDVYSDAPYVAPPYVFSPRPNRSRIFSAYDPNDKLVDGGLPDELNETEAGQRWFGYTIRFENTGNFSAKDIWVIDTLDPGFEPSSVQVTDASHAYTVELRQAEGLPIVRINLENIFLSPEDSLNQGYVKFAVRAREGVTVGDTLRNRAAIYFDQNPPIITNTVRNRLVEISVSNRYLTAPAAEISVYPNPASEWLRVESPHGISELNLLDATGRRVGRRSDEGRVELSGLPAGVYFLVVRTGAGMASRRVIVR